MWHPYYGGLNETPNLPGPNGGAPIMGVSMGPQTCQDPNVAPILWGSQWDPKPARTQLGVPYFWGTPRSPHPDVPRPPPLDDPMSPSTPQSHPWRPQ